ncbi:MAG: hypothetical protein K2X26_04595 [Chitinophagaceae bacterium]|nr:hypothetical protein [Chitinophagaceae bacterium]
MHNVLFPDTAYELIGFIEINGFTNTKGNDYIHKELGLILEDMHDENVLMMDDLLFFINTVFFIVEPS